MKLTLPIQFALLLWLGTGALCHAQGTAFTYQGRLTANSATANGSYDLQFTMYDSANGLAAVAGPVTTSAVPVANGLFTVNLDFGANVFTGAQRWLQISARPSSGGNFVTLTPRQPVTPAPYAIHAGAASNVANGAVVKSLNDLRDNVTLAGGSNVTLTANGNTLIISASGGAAGGSSLWSSTGNNVYYSAGNVGVGTTAPQGLMDIAGGGPTDTSALFVRSDPASFGRGGLIHHQSSTYGWQELAQVTGSATDGYLAFHYVDRLAPGTKVARDVLTLRGTGAVGIGTTAPSTKLTVYEPNSGFGIEHTDGKVRLGTYINSDGGWFGTLTQHKLHLFVNGGRSGFTGVIGMAGLQAADPFIPPDPFINPNPGVDPPLVLARSPNVTIDTSGNVGIGTASPTAMLEVAGDVKATRLILRADPLAPANAALLCENPNVANFVPFNTANGRPMNVIARDVTVRQLAITGGADLAEPFAMSHPGISPGSVVVIDDENPGNLKLSTQAYDRRVAGVVSGARGISPGITLRQEGALESGENVALTGRVYVQADATFGSIRPGDLLTTSETPGHAMKVSDHIHAQGAILGKAMSQLNEGQGMVLVLVTLQ